MPTLPTITINDQAVWNRVLTVFNNDPNEYKAWLRTEIEGYVRAREAQKIDTTNLLSGAT